MIQNTAAYDWSAAKSNISKQPKLPESSSSSSKKHSGGGKKLESLLALQELSQNLFGN